MTVEKLWDIDYGNKAEAKDDEGRLMRRADIGNPNSKFEPTIDHVNPIANGGKDTLSNLRLCNRRTNGEKGDRFPHWEANGKWWQARRNKNNNNPKRPKRYVIEEME